MEEGDLPQKDSRLLGWALGNERVVALVERGRRSIAWDTWQRMLEIEFVDRSIALAGKAFASFFPLVIVVAAFLPEDVRHSVFASGTHRIGLVGEAQQQARAAFASADDVRRATGTFGVVLTFFFASAFTTALQRVYLRTWRRPAGGAVFSYLRGAAWLIAFIVYIAVLGALRSLVGDETFGVGLFFIAAVVLSTLGWTTTAWVMLRMEVRYSSLLATGFLTGIVVGAYAITSDIWMPHQVISNENQFGIFGVMLSLITWLSGMAICILLGACIGVCAVEGDGLVSKVARLGRTGDLLSAGARPPLPKPMRVQTFMDAFGRSDAELDDKAMS